MKVETKIIQSLPIDELTGAISTPIYQTSTFVQESPGVNKGYDYARSNNPTRAVLEKTIAELENGYAGFAFASGLAAIDAVLKQLSVGDEIIAVDDIYGGTYRAFTHIYQKLGITIHYVDTSEVQNIIDKINPKTRLIWLESPTNPTLKISDIALICQLAKNTKIQVVVDNTFASPILQRPIDLGADIVIHSATKYLAGHSDVIAGLIVTRTAEIAEKIKFIQNSTGGILGPFDSWLTIRGITTLALRIEKQSHNALEIAHYLEKHPLVESVYYPGLKSHPNHEVAKKQQSLFGGVISFSLKEDTQEAAIEFVSSTQYFKLAESLGGVKSLICHPATMTHKSVPTQIRQKSGVVDSLIRLSAGIENASDLIHDLEVTFETLTKKTLSYV